MNCSVLNVVRLIQVKILAMKTAFACTVSVQTTKRQFGGGVYSVPPPPHVPHTKDHGWIVGEDRQLEINWICGLPAPLAVLKLLSCKCARACKLPNCTCLANELKCTDTCKLNTCKNVDGEEPALDMDYYSDESDDEDYDTE